MAVGLVLLATACTGGSGASSTGDEAGDTTAPEEEVTTTTDPPSIVALTPSLGLAPDQCWSEVPEVTTTTEAPDTTTVGPTTTLATTTTEPTVPETLGETATTLPRPPTIAVVTCEGTHQGRAFAAFCLLEDLNAETDRLTSGNCSVPSDLEWPGDRAVRRAAARICLQRFEEAFEESYAQSPLVAREFTPTEGVWELGDRRVVCTVDRLDPEVDDLNADSDG